MLEKEIKYEAEQWTNVLLGSTLKENYNDPVVLNKVIARMLREGVLLAKRKIRDQIDSI